MTEDEQYAALGQKLQKKARAEQRLRELRKKSASMAYEAERAVKALREEHKVAICDEDGFSISAHPTTVFFETCWYPTAEEIAAIRQEMDALRATVEECESFIREQTG